ncbi:hypothetical protein XENOCAPTIV_006084 [Xenoophorus captivus]|uniref:Uncharacterized protein n=1 Tax=Xenoophorus captivus TaxID=1517983 RepID=A0ABV0SDY1_9TELE
MNVTDFRDNALLKLQVAGPFAGRVVDPTTQEFILIQVEQAEEPGQRRRRTQQAFLQDNNVVPLSMTYQSLYVTKETQVAIAGIILAGVYVLIIFEVNGLLCCSDELFVVHCLWHSL